MLKLKHLVAGDWVEGTGTFTSDPADGPGHAFPVGTPALVAEAAEAAERAFWSYGYSTRPERAAFLRRIADEIDARGAEITEIGIPICAAWRISASPIAARSPSPW